MTLSLGIRLVILLPSILFLIGFSFKSIIVGKTPSRYQKLPNVWNANRSDFFFSLAIDALFIFVANGLIIMFEFNLSELGIVALICGVILSMCLIRVNKFNIQDGFFENNPINRKNPCVLINPAQLQNRGTPIVPCIYQKN